MKNHFTFLFAGFLLIAATAWANPVSPAAPVYTPDIPKVWDDALISSLELPLAEAAYSPKHISSEYYYRIPVHPLYKSYPVYHPKSEPAGYMEALRQREPEIIWDDQGHRPELKTEADWVRAGELVFDSPSGEDNGRIAVSDSKEEYLRDARWYERTGTPVTPEGIVPAYRYVIREKGKVEIGTLSCAACHTRIMPDGAVIKGAQGNFPFARAFAEDYRSSPALLPVNRALERMLYRSPWLPDPQAAQAGLTAEEIAATMAVIPPGVIARHRLRTEQPVQVPDLIGVQSRRYLDRPGLVRQRDIGDLMRYAALNQGADFLARFGDWVPLTEMLQGHPVPENPRDAPPGAIQRYSDEQLYALACYVYSLKPPANPHPIDAQAIRGKKVFETEGCARCHDPKRSYTNNKLVAAPGFKVPSDHPEHDHIMNRRVGTDATMTLTTNRGTGFYKVPSLLGVWYRGPFEHNGSVATLEDWFDPHRLEENYVPTGWKGPFGTKARAVPGHEFGLDLTGEERTDLIAFLRTL